jgi:thiol-disulfide isomerase/thioredoxin
MRWLGKNTGGKTAGATAVLVLLAAFASVCLAQSQEQADLEKALAEAGSSPLEYLRALEKHLEQYPDSALRPELERAAVRAAIEARDDNRIIVYGERVLARQPDDLQILEQVTRALLAGGSKEAAERALKYARRYEELVRQMQKDKSGAQWRNETDNGIGRALCNEARASGNLGRQEEALALAQRAFETYPNADSARETARCYERLGKPEEAAQRLADAFTIPDPSATDAGRANDRGRMGELYRQAKGSEKGLGDLVLQAYDRNVALIHTRELSMRESDPNAQLTDPMEFTLTGLDGRKLSMASLKGKVVVFDFWATWCEPCRGQHPLYEQVKQRFKDNAGVVFLSIDTDEDREPVRRFLEEEKWSDQVYFEDGLTRALRITYIPATIIIEKRGQVFSRMNGYAPERFVDLLTGRIRDALGDR